MLADTSTRTTRHQGDISPHAVAVRSVGVSMQMTHVSELNVVGFSSCCAAVCALTASSRCFCRTASTDESASPVRSTSSAAAKGDLLAALALPSSRFCRLAEGPGPGVLRLRRRGGESGAVRST
jgi:hypothetical protein